MATIRKLRGRWQAEVRRRGMRTRSSRAEHKDSRCNTTTTFWHEIVCIAEA
ncbi:hypothetical protein OCK02_02185 [Rhizobium sp. TRM96647]|uniref:hypothetical protein n=1 Tax=unclassified Rhizobium TaxID=2613769 RepID=UPI0021E70E64|nr:MULTISPECIES: hypothetical protein [unclassified Rhizobium]MCV3734998.1 hypothetical protein [Rhizobium sp. TRM96647]MCV3757368.1 hypothetical protein [Rhizobium sp. TRM96650]